MSSAAISEERTPERKIPREAFTQNRGHCPLRADALVFQLIQKRVSAGLNA